MNSPSRILLTALVLASTATAQSLVHPEAYLHHVYPAGARQGQTVVVEMEGSTGMLGATGVLVEGPPGVTVKDVKTVHGGKINNLQATLVVAPDAPVGKRSLRVLGGTCGLTNARPFFVSRLPEVMEKDPNDTPATAQEVTLPVVVNARINPTTDVDCFAFQARAGQRLVASVLAHGMDSMFKVFRMNGYLDASLELLDPEGRIVASAEDTIGLDPMIEYVVKKDGRYVIRVQSAFFKGSPSAVYRLTLGDVPCPTHVFPPGGKRGAKLDLAIGGAGIAPGTKQTFQVPKDGTPWLGLAYDHPLSDGRELPFIAGDEDEVVEVEAKDRKNAPLIKLGTTINGRFNRSGDLACYKVSLKKGQAILADVAAQRHLRCPVDTHVSIVDAEGKTIAENDDGQLYAHPNPCPHDFGSSDSWLPFTAPADGDYWVCIRDQDGMSGPQARYRLTLKHYVPDFELHQWPDAVPIWGPGSTASFVVLMQHWGGFNSNVVLRIEGLPEGWKGSTAIVSPGHYAAFNPPYGVQALLTITAPADAPVSSTAAFRVVGRAVQDGKVIEHTAQPMMLYGSGPSKRMHLRASATARAVVAPPGDVWLEPLVKELTVRLGETIDVPVRVHRRPGTKGEISVSIDGPINGGAAACAWRPPFVVKPDQTDVKIPMTLGGKKTPGVYGVVVSRSWISDLRGGRPGPCTPIIQLTVLPAK